MSSIGLPKSWLCVWAAFVALGYSGTVCAQIDFQVTINPIQVCDDFGFDCGNFSRQLFLDETDKIWAQAGIDIKFLDWKVMLDSDFTSNVVLNEIASASGNQEIGGDVINMWFVNSIEGGPFGQAGGGETIISNGVFLFSDGNGRRDTIAHEIGHVLGLPHIGGDDPFPLNLMEEGGDRDPVTDIGQIVPHGEQKGQLNASQISTTLNSFRVNSLDFGIPGDANRDGEVDEEDLNAFIAGWMHRQQDPDLNSWSMGDFNHDAITNLHDAYILHQALKGSAAGTLDFAFKVPEPVSATTLSIGMLLGVAVLFQRRLIG